MRFALMGLVVEQEVFLWYYRNWRIKLYGNAHGK